MIDWFKRQGLKIKIFIGLLISGLAIVAFFAFGRKLSAKQALNYQLEKKEDEIKIALLESDEKNKKKKLKKLAQERKEILKKIDIIEAESVERGHHMDANELNDFFDSRGF